MSRLACSSMLWLFSFCACGSFEAQEARDMPGLQEYPAMQARSDASFEQPAAPAPVQFSPARMVIKNANLNAEVLQYEEALVRVQKIAADYQAILFLLRAARVETTSGRETSSSELRRSISRPRCAT